MLRTDAVRTATCKALDEVRCIAIGRDILNKLLGDKIDTIMYRNIIKWGLEKCDGIKELTPGQKDKISDAIAI